MPSTIPYDPALTLGSILSVERLTTLENISDLQANADAAQDHLNGLIAHKRSLDMTILELVDLNVPKDKMNPLQDQSKKIGGDIIQAATEYGEAKSKALKSVSEARGKRTKDKGIVSSQLESPLDYNKSLLKQLPLSADSMNLNVQYFSHDENAQSSKASASSVASFVSASLSGLFEGSVSGQVSGSVQRQVQSQIANHGIAGTLVLCITCTHKNAQMFAPLILDPDKAIRAWNGLFPGDLIKPHEEATLKPGKIKAEAAFSILSGATYGSSFVGMVHILNTSETRTSQDMQSVVSAVQATVDVGGWFASAKGGFGVDASFSESAKNLLSTQNIQSHCSLVTMGIIPSIKSNQVKIGVQSFADFDPAKEMQQLAALQGATASASNTIASSADAARTGQQMISIKNATITATLSGLANIDDGANNLIDINSMMTAMDDYIQRCIAGGDNLGVPVNYYLKPITKEMIVGAWVDKYYPGEFDNPGSGDDSAKPGKKQDPPPAEAKPS